jgi:hypothetical protein
MSDSTDTPNDSNKFQAIEAEARRYGPRPLRVYLIHKDWLLWVASAVALGIVLAGHDWWLWLLGGVVVAMNIINVRTARRAWLALRDLSGWILLTDYVKPAPSPGHHADDRAGNL